MMRNTSLADMVARTSDVTPNITFEPPTPSLLISPMTTNQGLRRKGSSNPRMSNSSSMRPIDALTNDTSTDFNTSAMGDDIFAWQENVQSLSPAESRPPSVSSWSFCGSSVSGDESTALDIVADRGSPSGTATTSLSASPSGKSKVSHARKRAPGHVSRPRNAFILFRSHAINNNLIPTSLGVKDARAVSCIVASLWNSLPEDDKKQWRAVAQKEKIEHQLKYPDYRFKPDTNLAATFKPRQHAKTEEAVKEQCGLIADQILRSHGRSSAASDCGSTTKKAKKVSAPRARKAPIRGISKASLTVPTPAEEELEGDFSPLPSRSLRHVISAPQLGVHQEAPPMYKSEMEQMMPQLYHYDSWQQQQPQPLDHNLPVSQESFDYRCSSPLSYIDNNDTVALKLESLDMAAVERTPLLDSDQGSISPEQMLARLYSDPIPETHLHLISTDHACLPTTSLDALPISPMSTTFQDVDGNIASWQSWPLHQGEVQNSEMDYLRARQETTESLLDGAVHISSLAVSASFSHLDTMLGSHDVSSQQFASSDQSNFGSGFHQGNHTLRQVQTFQNLYELAQKEQVRNYQFEDFKQNAFMLAPESEIAMDHEVSNVDEATQIEAMMMEGNLSTWINDSM